MLLSRGVKKGDKVAILMYNCLEWLPIYFGILKTGALAVPFNFRYSAEEIEYCADLAEVQVLVFGPEFIGRIESVAEKLSKGRLLIYVGDNCPTFAESYRELSADCSSAPPQVLITDDDDGAIYFSSGTTGFPKAILHKHRSLTQAAEMEQKHHDIQHDDTFLCIPPLYHTGAKFHWMGSLFAGSKAVLLKGTSPEIILKAVSDEQCTIVWLLVPWAQDILDALDRGDIQLSDYKLDQWKLMHIGAQPVPPSLIRRWKEYFPHHKYDTNYGLSESTGPGCVHLGMENIHKVGAIGIPGYRWEVKVVDEQGNAVPKGEVGELCVKGPGDLLLQQPRSHRRGLEERLALHRRHGHAGRRRLLLPGGPEEGRGRLRRREHLPRPDRGLPAHQRQDQGRGCDRPARQASGRNLRRSHRAQAGCRLRRSGDQRLLPGSAPV